jgi:hypothetical protein
MIDIVFFDPNYWIFELGISLNRYEEYTENKKKFRVRKELVIGLMALSIRISFNFPKELPEVEK